MSGGGVGGGGPAISDGLDNFISACAGSIGAGTSTLMLFPLDVIKTRAQVDGCIGDERESRSITNVAKDVYKEGGLLAFYRGLMVKFTDNIAGKFAYFYLFSFFRNAASRTSKGAKLSTVVELAIGYLAAVGNLMLTHPLDVVYVRLASSPQGSTVTSTLQKLVREEGLFGLYQGTAAGLALCINPAIQFLVFERLKTQFLKATRSSSLTMLSGFFLGAVAKAIATSLTFPLIRLKALYSNGSVDKSRHGDSDPSLMEVLRDIYETEGMVGLYKGITPQLLKVCLSAAVMFSIKERIYDVTRALILARARRRARKLMAGK